MKKNIWKIVTLLLCCAMLVGVVACGSSDNNSNSNSNSGGATNTSSGDTGSGSAANTGSGGSNTGSGSNTGGGSNAGGSSTPKRDTLNVAYAQDGGTLDPLYNVGWDILTGIRLLYDPLWEQLQDLSYRYILAEPEVIDDLTLRAHIYPDAYFQSGNKVTAEDVLFTLDKANNRVGVSAFFSTMDMEKTRVIDELTIEMVFTESTVDRKGGFASFFIFDRLTYNGDTISAVPVGSGPYKLVDYVVGSHLKMEVNQDYWKGGQENYIPKINFLRLAEEAQRVNALLTGDVDVADVPYQDIDFVQNDLDNMEVYFFRGDRTCNLHMNPTTTRNCFSELGTDARRAIALAIDRDAIVRVAYSGYASKSRMPLSAGTPDAYPELFDMGIYGEDYNPTLAKQLAESSGLVNYKPLLINNGGSVQVVVTEIIQLNLKAIGVEIEVQTLDQGSWLTVAFDESQWDMAVDFTFGGTVAAGYRTWSRMMGGYNTSPWPGSERFMEIIEGPPPITTISDYNILNAYYMELTQIHTASIPWFVLCDVLFPYAHDVDLKGFEPIRGGSFVYTDCYW